MKSKAFGACLALALALITATLPSPATAETVYIKAGSLIDGLSESPVPTR